MQLWIYKHYKGKEYRVIGVGKHSDTFEDFVIYQALYNSAEFGDKAFWIKPKNLFLETVNFEGEKISRFKFLYKE